MNATTTLFATLKSLESKGYLVSRNNDAEEKLQVSSIQEYNEYLVYNKRLLPIVDYIEKVNELLWQHDISFMRTFLDYIDREDFCIDHAMIKDYGICDFAGGSGHLLTKLKSANLEEGEGKDYLRTNVREPVPQGGFVNKKVYTLTPNAFSILCMKTAKTNKYRTYYRTLERCVKYYNQYIITLTNKYVVILQDKLDLSEEGIARYPNVYGIDMPAADELIAHGRTGDEVCRAICADRLIYQDLDDMIDAVRRGNSRLTRFDCSVFTGEYITDVSVEYLEAVRARRNNVVRESGGGQLDLYNQV